MPAVKKMFSPCFINTFTVLEIGIGGYSTSADMKLAFIH